VNTPTAIPSGTGVGAIISAKSSCPAGKRVIGGGFNLADTWGREMTPLTSYPDTNQSWFVELRNRTGSVLLDFTVQVYAICAAN
jgi:hypothetical protein